MRRVTSGICAVLLLSACGGGNEPSEKQMQAAFESELKLAASIMGGKPATVRSFDKEECHEASEGRVRCTYSGSISGTDILSKQPFTNNFSESTLFEKRGDNWIMIKG